MLWSLPHGIETPALVVDRETLVANLDAMAGRIREAGVALRPHAKTHKSVEVGALQLARGAAGLTAASLGEAEVFADAGCGDLFIAYPLYVPPAKVDRLRRLAERVRLSVGLDSLEAAGRLSASGMAGRLEVLVEIDSGQHRSGVRPEVAGELASRCREMALRVVGVFTHGGHGYHDRSAPPGAAADERAALETAVAALSRHGIEPVRVSAGSTPTAVASASGAVNEERPGTYVFNDRQQVELGTTTLDHVAAAVVATVVSTAVDGQVVLDAGSKALSSDRPAWLSHHGIVPELADAPVTALSECHGLVSLPPGVSARVGTVVRVVPNHVCPVVNLFDHYDVVSNGVVVDRWPVSARGHLT